MMKVIKKKLNTMNPKSNQVLGQLWQESQMQKRMIKGTIRIKKHKHKVIRKGSQHLHAMRGGRIQNKNEMKRQRHL